MEHIIKDELERLSAQRLLLVEKLIELDENMPQHSIKVIDLDNQINKIDMEKLNYINQLMEIKRTEQSNDYSIKTLIK